MEERCASSGCSKPVEYTCDCGTPRIYLCEAHLTWHISSRKKSDHSAKRIESLHENESRDCHVCMRKSSRYLCLCRSTGVKLCPECYDLHALQNTGKHTKEPIEASDFIKSERDVLLYLERKDQIDGILKVISDNQREIQSKEEIFRMANTRMLEKLKKWYEEKLSKISQTKRALKKFEDDIKLCKFQKDIASHWISGFLKERDYSKVFKTVRMELNEESMDQTLRSFLILEQEPLLLQQTSSVKPESTIFITEKDTGSMYQRISSVYSDHASELIPKLYSLYTRALEPSKLEQIQQIELSNCMLGAGGCKYLAVLLPALIQLTYLNLCSNSIGPYGAKEIGPAVAQVKTLSTLLLAWNKLENKGMEYISEALPELPQLRILQLSWNEITEAGAKFLGRGLAHCEKLEKLELWNNPLGPEGLRNLILTLPYLTKLKTLDLNRTELGSEGAELLAVLLPKLPELVNLAIANNQIGGAGIRSLSKAFGANKNLQIVDLTRNGIRGDGSLALSEAMCKLQKETTIMIGGNMMNKEDKQKLSNSASNAGLRLTHRNAGN